MCRLSLSLSSRARVSLATRVPPPVAGAVAEALGASRLLLLTDVAGVLDASKTLVTSITRSSAKKLIAEGVISGGMIPKLQTALQAVWNSEPRSVFLFLSSRETFVVRTAIDPATFRRSTPAWKARLPRPLSFGKSDHRPPRALISLRSNSIFAPPHTHTKTNENHFQRADARFPRAQDVRSSTAASRTLS